MASSSSSSSSSAAAAAGAGAPPPQAPLFAIGIMVPAVITANTTHISGKDGKELRLIGASAHVAIMDGKGNESSPGSKWREALKEEGIHVNDGGVISSGASVVIEMRDLIGMHTGMKKKALAKIDDFIERGGQYVKRVDARAYVEASLARIRAMKAAGTFSQMQATTNKKATQASQHKASQHKA